MHGYPRLIVAYYQSNTNEGVGVVSGFVSRPLCSNNNMLFLMQGTNTVNIFQTKKDLLLLKYF